jgi:flagellum-specific ATP synthase
LQLENHPPPRDTHPSVFAALPKLLERTGNFPEGSITGLYTVLVEGDDFNEPISDAMRSILDGHIVLSRDLAARNIYPPIDILASASRVMSDVTDERHRKLAGQFKEALATYRQSEDLINIGAYKSGSNPGIDHAIRKIDAMTAYQKQAVTDPTTLADSIEGLQQIFET